MSDAWSDMLNTLTRLSMDETDPERRRRAAAALNVLLKPLPRNYNRFHITEKELSA